MTQPSEQKPAIAPKPNSKSEQPTSTELSPKELDQVAGGMSIPKKLDKASPKLFIG